MNGLEEIQKIIQNFICDSEQSKQEIAEIERKRMEIAEKRNEKKQLCMDKCKEEICMLGNQISELGNQSQEIQNKLDSKFNEVKKLVNLMIDNLITERIRKVRKIDEERQELEERIALKEERNLKYEMQKQEFYERFGRTPELSKNAEQEDEIQDKQCNNYKERIEKIEETVKNVENELVELVSVKTAFEKGDWSSFICSEKAEICEEESKVLPLLEKEIQIGEIEPVEKIEVEELEPIQAIEIGNIEPIEEISIEELVVEPFECVEEKNAENKTVECKQEQVTEQKQIDEIEELARAIVEQIVAEQTQPINIAETEKQQTSEKTETIKCEEKQCEKAILSNIIVKIEDGEIVYKAQISNGEEIKIYSAKTSTGNALLNDKGRREEIKTELISYANNEYKRFDKTVIKKIDTIVCEVISTYARKYNCNEMELIYNYAMSFSKTERNKINNTIPITYNFSYIESTGLSKAERKIISRICKNAFQNEGIDIIGYVKGFSKIKYILTKIFATNSVKRLTDGKY